MNPLISFPIPELEISCVFGAVPCLLPQSQALLCPLLELCSDREGRWAEGAGAPWVGTRVVWGCFREPLACRLSSVQADYAPEVEQNHRTGFHPCTQTVGTGGVQCLPVHFHLSSIQISLPHTDFLLSSILTCSSGSDGDSDVDSELEERVDGVKSWLSKNKGSSKALSDDGSLKGSRWVQGWAQGWQAEDRLSCAGTWPGLGGCPWDVAFGAVCLHGWPGKG